MSGRDAIVVGAGPAGSTAAFALARAGWDVLLLEADRSPNHKVCGEFLSPESRVSLKRLGLLDVVTACAPATVSRAQLTSIRGQTVQLPLAVPGWGLSRRRLDAALSESAKNAGVRVEYGVRALHFETLDPGYRVHVRSRVDLKRRTLHTRALLWAAGRSWSTPAREIETAHEIPKRSRHVGVKCHYADAAVPAHVELYFFRGGYVGVNAIEDGLSNVCVMASHATFVRADRSPATLLEMAMGSSPSLRARMRCARAVDGTLKARFPVDPTRRATPWDGAPRLGDAVASIAPLCGDGIAMALRSAELCVPGADSYLRGATSLPAWEASYRRAWRAECDARCRTGRFLQGVLGTPLLSDVFVSVARAVPALARYFVYATRGPVHPADASSLG